MNALNNKEQMETICSLARLPIEWEKSQGSTTLFTFLGIEIDTQRGELWLSAGKKDKNIKGSSVHLVW